MSMTYNINEYKSGVHPFHRPLDMDASDSGGERKHPDDDDMECDMMVERRCQDGSCISKMDLCPDEQIMNQNTILIMIVVGMAVVIFLIILYCFQQRQRGNGRAGRNTNFESINGEESGDGDNASLFLPPPTYEEVITTNLYPVTPQMMRSTRMSSSEDPPMTPPPNYEVALNILAQSHESVLIDKNKKGKQTSPVIRRSISIDHMRGQYVPLREVPSSPTRTVQEERS